jgi:hypothetical protein
MLSLGLFFDPQLSFVEAEINREVRGNAVFVECWGPRSAYAGAMAGVR